MLSKIQIKEDFRSISKNTLLDAPQFGRKTIVYGHNGSGKSSFSEMLYRLANGELPTAVEWSDHDGSVQHIPSGEMPEKIAVSVFTKAWIKDNLGNFLDGETAQSIVVLGSEAVDAKKREDVLEAELADLGKELNDAEDRLDESRKSIDYLVSAVQDSIVDTLRSIDPMTYTKNRFNTRVVRKRLEDEPDASVDEEAHDRNLQELKAGPLSSVNVEILDAPMWNDISDTVTDLINRAVKGDLIEEILGNPELQDWIQSGLNLHQSAAECQFCTGRITNERRSALDARFDDSRSELQQDIDRALGRLRLVRERLSSWVDSLPAVDAIYRELQEEYLGAMEADDRGVSTATEFLNQAESLLKLKRQSPERLQFETLVDPPGAIGHRLRSVVLQHNEISEAAGKRQKETADAVVRYIVRCRAMDYRDLQSKEANCEDEQARIRSIISEKEASLDTARAKQHSSYDMATKLSNDLALVYSRAHLSIQVSDDGRAYSCLRNGKPATHLSEGERNSLALLYFLRLLQDESIPIDPAKRLVVVDDPSSSFDREAVFATHSLLIDRLAAYGQYIILTHDFELLRLLMYSQKSQLGKLRGILKNRDSGKQSDIIKAQKEELFPRIAFLELSAATDQSGVRRSKLSSLSSPLLDYRSEYHFLFARVSSAVGSSDDNDDADTLFLLPNAARRMLESFASFHAPHVSNFLGQMKLLAVDERDSAFRDVYDFCNRFSHGEGRETLLSLDAHATRSQLRRCLEFMEAVDPNHVAAMRQAVNAA